VNLLDGDCTVITPVGLDHQEYLGDTREAIGYEKAGIIRRGRPLVLGDRDPPASVLEVARPLEAPVRRIGRDYELTAQGDHAVYRYDARSLELPRPPLAGAHQFDNAATGLAAVLELLPDAIDQAGALRRGLDSVRVRGRFEQVAAAPAIWIDVGHNPLGAEVVARTLAERMPADGAGQVRCVFGMLADKDAAAVVRAMRAVVNGWYCAGLGSSRGQSGARLAAQVREAVDPATVVRTFGTVAEALEAAREDSGPADGVLVFGSFLTADAALRALGGGA
jgi:dihydrofolate synthase/folylpolyglutamate synthase